MQENFCDLSPTYKWRVHLLAGSVAGLAEHCVMFPFDSVKTRMQSLCPCPETKCPTAMHSLFTMVKREGLLRPLKGVNAIVLGAVPAHALYYTVYEKSKVFFRRSHFGLFNSPSASYAASGILATAVHDAVMNPAEVVKQRMQMVFSPYGNSLECVRCIYVREGIRAFYRSYITQLTLNIPYQCSHFVIYELMQDLLNPEHSYNALSHFISGGFAGGVAAAITTPLDCIKTVLNTQQTPQFDSNHRLLYQGPRAASYRGFTDGFRTIYYLRGLRGFFRGLQARVIFQVPSTALSWSAYELCKYILSL
ncbi:unnamed protein product [Gongylonema pulchrum]|uniref:Mitochondrial carrier protein n=1 Tax=Gongylonema pulchrum TaxID=637853 RepID=A0A183E4C4_9BILA|nr:unnamed protein product [Gongylonema pulchrum]